MIWLYTFLSDVCVYVGGGNILKTSDIAFKKAVIFHNIYAAILTSDGIYISFRS